MANETIILDSSKTRLRSFGPLHPKPASTKGEIVELLGQAERDTLWLVFKERFAEILLDSLALPLKHKLGRILLFHEPRIESLAVMRACFDQVLYVSDAKYLKPDELSEVLIAENRQDLFIGGVVDEHSKIVTLWRGNLEPLAVPFEAFKPSGAGTAPDFSQFRVRDYGHTIAFGAYEASADAILYEYDPDYRRRIKKIRQTEEKTFGAALRRLRKQRGLSRKDFAPSLSAKTIARRRPEISDAPLSAPDFLSPRRQERRGPFHSGPFSSTFATFAPLRESSCGHNRLHFRRGLA